MKAILVYKELWQKINAAITRGFGEIGVGVKRMTLRAAEQRGIKRKDLY